MMREIDLSPGQPLQPASSSGSLGVIGRRSVSDLGAIGDNISPSTANTGGMHDQLYNLQMLEAASYRLPQPKDSERAKTYTPVCNSLIVHLSCPVFITCSTLPLFHFLLMLCFRDIRLRLLLAILKYKHLLSIILPFGNVSVLILMAPTRCSFHFTISRFELVVFFCPAPYGHLMFLDLF